MDGKHPHSQDARSLPTEPVAAGRTIDIKHLERLVSLLDRSDVSEVEVKSIAEGTHLVLRKIKVSTGSEQQTLAQQSLMMPAATPAPVETRQNIVAPLVGTFHTRAKPRGGILVAAGDQVKVGQLVATIESLNVINDVEAHVAGRVVEILVQEGQPVEYGQALMVVETAEGL
ncbi:MAG: biotin/lipoyl-containing protein [Ktedonobacteraceae bacterium]|nr:biotin/lipoyl-binding protein [Chloroflexota bacterium]